MIYFAHPMGTYNTDVEKACIREICNHFGVKESEIINPNEERIKKALHLLQSKASLRSVMVFFYLLVDISDTVVFLTYSDDTVGIGVWGEIKHTMNHHEDMPIYRIIPKSSEALWHCKIEVMSVPDILELKLLTMDETVAYNDIPEKNYKTIHT